MTSGRAGVVVVGGGVTGLAAARRLAAAGLRVTLLEAGGELGGKLRRRTVGGLLLDVGAESMLARRPEGLALVDELGLAHRRVHPTGAAPQLLVGGLSHDLPPSLQGVPTDVDALAPLLSPAGLAFAAGEPHRPAPPLEGDLSIGEYVGRRFGPEVVDRLLEPLLGGVYAGRAERLSFAAVHPALFALARSGGSLLGHARALLRPGGPTGPVFAGLASGVGGLVEAIVADLEQHSVSLRTGTTVTALEPDGPGWRLTLDGTKTGRRTLRADGVLLAVPGPSAGRLLDGLAASASGLAGLGYAAVAVVTLVVRHLDSERSGLLVPPGERPTVKAVTHSSAKWAWVREQATAAYGPGVDVVRVSLGRVGETTGLQAPDDVLLDRTVAEARTLPGWAGVSVLHRRLTRWGGALPQYAPGHPALVARLRAETAALPGLALAGAALDGVGIPACLASAHAAAQQLSDHLDGRAGTRRRTPDDRLQESRR